MNKDRTTISVSRELKQKLDQKKPDDLSYEQWLRRSFPEDGQDTDVDTEALAESLQDHIDYPEQQDTEVIMSRLNDLRSNLPKEVAQELQR